MVQALFASFAPAPSPAPVVVAPPVAPQIDYGAVLSALAANNTTAVTELFAQLAAPAPAASAPVAAAPSYWSGVWNGAQLVLFAGATTVMLRARPS